MPEAHTYYTLEEFKKESWLTYEGLEEALKDFDTSNGVRVYVADFGYRVEIHNGDYGYDDYYYLEYVNNASQPYYLDFEQAHKHAEFPCYVTDRYKRPFVNSEDCDYYYYDDLVEILGDYSTADAFLDKVDEYPGMYPKDYKEGIK